MPAFAAFASLDVTGHTNTKRHPSGVERVNCKKCGSPLSAVFPYLPDQIYVPIGILDDIDAHAPQLHCHAASQPSWLHLPDGLAREDASARTRLAEAGDD
ncbi:GFA family protein [Octadecabacter sp. G9-8]|uniref:GFA family protein n=1 Tax=Octadecabacter dasysiphoniae TaxID=2909341 RepID=A0ABS9CQX0_9RHOB|nr:GFA family protein [Octadecabacter dasysiphoniae]